MSILQKIADIEAEMARTQKNKASFWLDFSIFAFESSC